MRPLSSEQVSFIIQNFKNTENIVLAEKAGCSLSAINRIQGRYHLKKSKEHLRKMYSESGKRNHEKNGNIPISEDAIRRRVETWKKRYREEKARVAWGLEPISHIKVRKEPRAKQQQRNYLKRHGYIVDNFNNIAYWKEDTIRAVRMERKPKYFKFKPYEEQ